MSKILIPLTILFLIGWALGFVVYDIGTGIHLLLAFAVFTYTLKTLKEE
ncbi:MAG: DUF5670 family protein [Sediminicola sp.]